MFFFSRIFMLLSQHEDAERFSTVKMNPITNKITRSYEHLTIEFSDEEKLTVNHLNKHLSLSEDGTGTTFKLEGSRWIGQKHENWDLVNSMNCPVKIKILYEINCHLSYLYVKLEFFSQSSLFQTLKKFNTGCIGF